jgi:SAM-dependent methyltransferase
MSGFQLSGDAPTAYTRFALKIVEPWTDDLILAASCRDGDRVLDVACGTGVVASRVNLVSRKLCYVTGIDINEGMLNAARANSQVEWHQGSATELPFGEARSMLLGRSWEQTPRRHFIGPSRSTQLMSFGSLQMTPDYGTSASVLSIGRCAIRCSNGFVTGWVSGAPITGQFLTLSDDHQRSFVARFVERLTDYVDDAGLAVPMENHFLTAEK